MLSRLIHLFFFFKHSDSDSDIIIFSPPREVSRECSQDAAQVTLVNVWNSLPDNVVDVNSLKQFEKRLDKFWGNQNVMFDWTVK